MKTLLIGNNDTIPVIGLGTWKSPEGELYKSLVEALKMGYRHIDCAAIYGNEEEVGRALKHAMDEGIVRRESLWITSKLWNNSHRPELIRPALEKTLRDLQLDYLDLYLIHWPVALKAGVKFPDGPEDFLSLSEVPLDTTWVGMEACADAELTRYIGVSNYSMKKMRDLLATARRKPAMNQVELHPFLQQSALVDYCHKNGVRVTGYSPLGSGDRPDRLRNVTDPILKEHPTIKVISKKHKCTWAQVVLAWAMQRNTIPIPKSVNKDRLKENFDAIDIELDEEDMDRITLMDRHFRYVDGSTWTPTGTDYSLATLWDER